MGANLNEIIWQPIETGQGPWLEGRGARVLIQEKEVGQIGELDPNVSSDFGLRVPIQAGEFDIDAIGLMIQDPVL